MNTGAGGAGGRIHPVGIGDGQRNRLFHKYGLAKLQRLDCRRRVIGLSRRDNHRTHLIIIDEFGIIARMVVGADIFGQARRLVHVEVTDRQIGDRWMRRRHAGAQCPHAAGPDDRNPILLVAHEMLLIYRPLLLQTVTQIRAPVQAAAAKMDAGECSKHANPGTVSAVIRATGR